MDAATTETFRLSPQQTRLAALGKRHHGLPMLVHGRIRLEGEIAPAAVADGWRRVVQRHEILRTVFPTVPGLTLPTQAVLDRDPTLWLPRRNLSGLAGEALEEALEEATSEAQEAPWDLAAGPLTRLRLVTLGPAEELLLVTVAALLADGPSLELLTRELASALGGDSDEAEPEAPQYADLASWQNDVLEDPDAEEGRAFWSHWTRDLVPSALPLARGPGSERPHRVPVTLDREESAALARIGERFGVEPADLLLAVWAVVLQGRVGTPELTLGVALAGRSFEELVDAVGPLARTVPVACAPRPGDTWRDLASRLRTARAEAEDWQEYFQWESGASGTDVVVCPLAFELREAPTAGFPGGTASLADARPWTEPFDLRLTGLRSDERLHLHVDFDSRRLEGRQAAHAAQALREVIRRLAAAPDGEVPAAPVLGAQERQALVAELGAATAPLPETTVLSLFEDRADREPRRTAVLCGDASLSYGELDRRAALLARRLTSLGVGPEVPVALLLERSPLMVVALLGVWKAGGAYVALDPTFPAERQAVVLEGVRVLVTDAVESAAPPGFTGEVVRLEPDAIDETEPVPRRRPPAASGALAYVLYTSGSTGRPKGVAVAHRSLLNYTLRTCAEVGAREAPLNFLNLTTLAADLGHTTIFPALASGGAVALMSYEEATDVLGFARFVEDRRIDVIKITPGHLTALLAAGDDLALPPRVVVGGEAFPLSLAERVAELRRECRLVNEYGPTEATVGCVAHAFEGSPAVATPGPSVPVGRPLPNTRAYVLDARLAPVPTGANGELHLAGACLARGYLRRPTETADRFLPDPLAGVPGERMYRTGDLARHLAGGLLDCLGRLDHQVKVRGFRVELGEIEAVCRAQPGVREAVVLPDGEGADPGLTAYVVREDDGPLEGETLQVFLDGLRRHLPEVMIPAAVVAVERMPLTVNGKVDRQTLAKLRTRRDSVQAPYEAPRDEVERTLAAAWAEVLGTSRVGIDDNFFALGGDSIRSIRLRYLAQESGLTFTTGDLFRHPTIRLLARHVATGSGEEEDLQRVDDMSPAEVDELLAELMDEEGAAT